MTVEIRRSKFGKSDQQNIDERTSLIERGKGQPRGPQVPTRRGDFKYTTGDRQRKVKKIAKYKKCQIYSCGFSDVKGATGDER